MDNVAEQLNDVMAHQLEIQEKEDAGMKMPPGESPHMIMGGPPGTGKSTVAEHIAEAYALMGVTGSDKKPLLKKPADLIGDAMGVTEKNTKEALAEADQGVLLIDEAHQLADSKYGRKVIETLLAPMADRNDKTVIILAGYGDKLEKTLKVDPGFGSRFQNRIDFRPYTADELSEITRRNVAANNDTQDEEAEEAMDDAMDLIATNPKGANVRDANQMLAWANVARRKRNTPDVPLKERSVLIPADWMQAAETYKMNVKRAANAEEPENLN